MHHFIEGCMNVLYLIDVLMKQEKTNDECLRIYSY